MVKNTINSIVNPETPNVNPKQQISVYVPIATYADKGIAKFYEEHFSVVDGLVKINKDYVQLLESFPLRAEGFAVGEQNGVAVTSGTYYQNNAKYYCEQAHIHSEDSLTNANSSRTSAEDAKLAKDAVYKYIDIIDNGIFSIPYNKTEQVINSDVTVSGTLKSDVEASFKKLKVENLYVTGTSTVENAKNLQLEDNLIVTNYSETYSKYSGLVTVNSLSNSLGNISASALLYDNSVEQFVIGKGILNESEYDFSFEFDDDGYSFVVSSETNPSSYTNNVLVTWKNGKVSSSGKTLSDLDTSYVKRKTHNEDVIYVYTESKNGQSSLRCKSSLNFAVGEPYASIPYRNKDTQSFHVGTVDFDKEENNNYPLTVGSAKAKLVLSKDYNLLLNHVGNIYTDLHVLIGNDTDKSARAIAQEELLKIIEDAPSEYNSFMDIYNWINTHGSEVAELYNEFDKYVKKLTTTDKARYAYINDGGTEGKIRIIYNVGSSEQAVIDKGGKPYTVHTIPCRNHYGGLTVTDPIGDYDAVNKRTLERYKVEVGSNALSALGITATPEEINALDGYNTGRGSIEDVMSPLLQLVYAGGTPGINYSLTSLSNTSETVYAVAPINQMNKYSKSLSDIKVANMIFGNSVVEIAKEAFKGHNKLETVELPYSLVKIDDSAFEGCTNLQEIVIPKNVTYVGDAAFRYCSNIVIYCENSSEYASDNWSTSCIDDVTRAVWNYTGSHGITDGGVKWAKTKEGVIICGSPTPNSEITIPSQINGVDVTQICNAAFSFNKNVESIIIPDTVLDIGSHAFRGCDNLKSVSLSTGSPVNYIPPYAFYMCSNLSKIVITSSVTEIGPYAFAGCTNIGSISVASHVKSIANGAFSECTSMYFAEVYSENISTDAFEACLALKNVRIGSTVRYIKANAFPSSVKTVMYEGTEEQWNNIQIGSGNFENATIQFNK